MFKLEAVAAPPPKKPLKNPPREKQSESNWPTPEDVYVLRLRWTQGAYAGTSTCKCGYFGYCYGPTYDKKTCLDCYVEKHRPKRKYTKRKS